MADMHSVLVYRGPPPAETERERERDGGGGGGTELRSSRILYFRD